MTSSAALNPIVIVPSRMGSSRLPGKALADIAGVPMVVHVWHHGIKANIGPVFVACDHQDIAQAVQKAGGNAVLTSSHHLTGSDRIQEAVDIIDPQENHHIVINVQGDLPYFPPSLLSTLLEPFQDPSIDITTFIQHEKHSGSRGVKARTEKRTGKPWHLCTDFQRYAPTWTYTHLGFYAFRRSALKRFSECPPTPREISASLEQLRALDHGLVIAGIPVGPHTFVTVDTPDDLHAAQRLCASPSVKALFFD